MMAERGIVVDHSTLNRWVICLVPLLENERNLHQNQRPVKIAVLGSRRYGTTIDFLLTAKRHASAALRFFRKAIRHQGKPEVVTIDKSGVNAAVLPYTTPTNLMRQ